MISFTIPGRPITKKNHQQICRSKTGKPFVRQSKRYTDYETAAGYFIPCKNIGIDYLVNVQCGLRRTNEHRLQHGLHGSYAEDAG